MAKISVKSNAADREITLDEPNVLSCSTLADLAESLGEELCVNMIKNQFKVSFRAVVRRKLEEKDDNEDFVNSDDSIMAEDYSDWKPTLRITKTPEEKALEALGNLPPEVREAVLASFNNTPQEVEDEE
jgi:hypothetical protein